MEEAQIASLFDSMENHQEEDNTQVPESHWGINATLGGGTILLDVSPCS